MSYAPKTVKQLREAADHIVSGFTHMDDHPDRDHTEAVAALAGMGIGMLLDAFVKFSIVCDDISAIRKHMDAVERENRTRA